MLCQCIYTLTLPLYRYPLHPSGLHQEPPGFWVPPADHHNLWLCDLACQGQSRWCSLPKSTHVIQQNYSAQHLSFFHSISTTLALSRQQDNLSMTSFKLYRWPWTLGDLPLLLPLWHIQTLGACYPGLTQDAWPLSEHCKTSVNRMTNFIISNMNINALIANRNVTSNFYAQQKIRTLT